MDEMYKTDISNVRGFCSNPKELKYLSKLSPYTSNRFVTKCFSVYDIIEDKKKRKMVDTVTSFFDAFPNHYLTDIYHHSNTCFLAASAWMFGSMRLLVRLLYFNKSQSSPSLRPLIEAMYPVYKKDKRPELRQINQSCVIYEGYVKGSQDDLTLNLNAILDNIKPKILNRSVVSYSDKTAYLFVDLNGTKLDFNSNRIQAYFNRYVTARQEIYESIISSYNGPNKEKYIRTFGLLFPETGMITRNPVSPLLQTLAKLEGHKNYKEITTFDRFCGKTKMHSVIVNQELCDLVPLYSDANKLYNYMSTQSDTSASKYVYTLPVNDYRSVQAFLDDANSSTDRDIQPVFDNNEIYMITQSARDINSSATYLIIMFIFEGKTSVTKKGVKNIVGGTLSVNNLEIDNMVRIGDNNFLLTSVGVKSGSANSGHWWSLVRDERTETFIRYDDLGGTTRYKETKIKKTGGTPSVLIYTNLG